MWRMNYKLSSCLSKQGYVLVQTKALILSQLNTKFQLSFSYAFKDIFLGSGWPYGVVSWGCKFDKRPGGEMADAGASPHFLRQSLPHIEELGL